LFNATWRRLPGEVRASILNLWQPSIETLPTFVPVRLIGRNWPRSQRATGFVSHEGTEIAFDGPRLVEEFPPYATETIAHELAHVYQYAIGRRMDLIDAEADVDRLLREWQFWYGPLDCPSREYAANAVDASLEAF
jgi:hypothetical protein